MASDTTPTPKQKKVLKGLAQGKTATDIAKTMKVQPQSVYNHMRALREAGLLNPDNEPIERPTPSTPGELNGSSTFADLDSILEHAIQVADARSEEIETRLSSIKGEIESLDAEGQSLYAEKEELTKKRHQISNL